MNLRRKVFALNLKYVKSISTTNLQIDHIYLKSKNDSNVLDNSQTLCVQCNLKKDNKFESQFSKFNRDVKSGGLPNF